MTQLAKSGVAGVTDQSPNASATGATVRRATACIVIDSEPTTGAVRLSADSANTALSIKELLVGCKADAKPRPKPLIAHRLRLLSEPLRHIRPALGTMAFRIFRPLCKRSSDMTGLAIGPDGRRSPSVRWEVRPVLNLTATGTALRLSRTVDGRHSHALRWLMSAQPAPEWAARRISFAPGRSSHHCEAASTSP